MHRRLVDPSGVVHRMAPDVDGFENYPYETVCEWRDGDVYWTKHQLMEQRIVVPTCLRCVSAI